MYAKIISKQDRNHQLCWFLFVKLFFSLAVLFSLLLLCDWRFVWKILDNNTLEKLAPLAADNSNCCYVYMYIEIKDGVSCCRLCIQPLLNKGSSFLYYLSWDLIKIFQAVSKIEHSLTDRHFWQISSGAPGTISLQVVTAKAAVLRAHVYPFSFLPLCRFSDLHQLTAHMARKESQSTPGCLYLGHSVL